MQLSTMILLAGLKAGGTLSLPAGDHAMIEISRRRFDPPAVIDASGATVSGLRLTDVDGLVIRGGTFRAPQGKAPEGHGMGNAIQVRGSSRLAFEGLTVTDAVRGIVIGSSQDVAIRRVTLAGLRSDGVNLASVQRALVEDVRCEGFTPVRSTGSRADGTFRDGDHPDCIQGWNRADAPATADITVRRVTARGDMQGIFFRSQQGRGRFERIVFEDNDIEVSYGNGVVLAGDVGAAIVRGNRIAPLPGAARQRIMLRLADGVLACGNRVVAFPFHEGSRPCRADEASRTFPTGG